MLDRKRVRCTRRSTWSQVSPKYVTKYTIMRESVALDGVLDLNWSKYSLISKCPSCEGPLRLMECLTSNDQGTHQYFPKYYHKRYIALGRMFDLKWSKYYKSISHKVLLLFSSKPNTMLGGCPQTCWPEYDGWGYRVTTLSSHLYNPNYHICESIYYFADYQLLLIGSCLSYS